MDSSAQVSLVKVQSSIVLTKQPLLRRTLKAMQRKLELRPILRMLQSVTSVNCALEESVVLTYLLIYLFTY